VDAAEIAGTIHNLWKMVADGCYCTAVSSQHGAMSGLMAVFDVDASGAENRDMGMTPWEDNGGCDAAE